jgi:arabinofuranosyltransferase
VKRDAPPAFLWKVGLAVALAWGLWHAISMRWMCDDAYIVLRYAKNFANGLGLVYNAGERVEGYTDLAWVLWSSLAFRLGIKPETWLQATSVLCYGAVILLLALRQLRRRHALDVGSAALPAAALFAAFHPDWNVFATSGLETSAFTFLLVAGYVSTVSGNHGAAAAARTAGLFALASLVRPDGILPAFLAGLFFLAYGGPRLRSGLTFGAVFLLVWGPVQLWRVSFYGDFFPNTYYAKSAMLAWWSQGWVYTRLYFQKYWLFLLALPALAVAIQRIARMEPGRRAPYRTDWFPEVLLAGAIAVTYTLYIARVGGDFMYARMLIPATPFYALLVELGLAGLAGFLSRRTVGAVIAFGLWTLLTTPRPPSMHRIGHEWAVYTQARARKSDYLGTTLRNSFAGLDVRIIVYGMQARLAYRSEASYVLEADGLTDPYVARLPIRERGWPGHEKLASASYTVDQRKTHFAFQPDYFEKLGFADLVPIVPVTFGQADGFVLRWDAPLMAELKRRGAVFPDYPAEIDHYVENAFHCPADEIAADFARFRRFYFDDNPDPPREELFRELIERGSALPPDARR